MPRRQLGRRGYFLKILRQLCCDIFRRHGGRESRYYLAIPPHQKLREVPGNGAFAFLIRLGRGQHLIQRAGAVAIDLDLGEHGEIGLVVRLREFQDFLIAARLLRAELIARESQDRKALVGELFLQSTQPGVLWGKASAAGDVDDETELIAILAEVDFFAANRRHGQAVEIAHWVCAPVVSLGPREW